MVARWFIGCCYMIGIVSKLVTRVLLGRCHGIAADSLGIAMWLLECYPLVATGLLGCCYGVANLLLGTC